MTVSGRYCRIGLDTIGDILKSRCRNKLAVAAGERPSAAGILPREARLNNRSQDNEATPPAPKRSRSTPAFRRTPRVAPAAAQNQPQFTGDQYGALLQSVEALAAVVCAQSVQQFPAPVASDNR